MYIVVKKLTCHHFSEKLDQGSDLVSGNFVWDTCPQGWALGFFSWYFRFPPSSLSPIVRNRHVKHFPIKSVNHSLYHGADV